MWGRFGAGWGQSEKSRTCSIPFVTCTEIPKQPLSVSGILVPRGALSYPRVRAEGAASRAEHP